MGSMLRRVRNGMLTVIAAKRHLTLGAFRAVTRVERKQAAWKSRVERRRLAWIAAGLDEDAAATEALTGRWPEVIA
jgi:hypothetical protein